MKHEILKVEKSRYSNSWVVYYRLDNGMSHPGRLYFPMTKAPDELAAYVQAMRILEGMHDGSD